jgi:hypothetical protein
VQVSLAFAFAACKGDPRDAAAGGHLFDASSALGTSFSARDGGDDALAPLVVSAPTPDARAGASVAGPTGSNGAGAPASPIASSLAALGSASPSVDQGAVVLWGVPRVTGGLLTDLEPTLRRMRAGVRACYERFLEGSEEPETTATLSLRLVVMPNGSVRRASASEVVGLDQGTVDCIVRRAQMATLPPPVSEGAEVTLPITLRPR